MLNRYFGRAAYVVGTALIVIPMFDAGTSVLPLRLGESRWRYGTIGLLSNSLLIPLAGVLVVFAVAAAFAHRRTLRALGVVAALASLTCVVAVFTFALDAIQSQAGIRPELQTAYVVGSSTAAVKLLIGAAAFAYFALAALKRDVPSAGKGSGRDRILVGDLTPKRDKPANASV